MHAKRFRDAIYRRGGAKVLRRRDGQVRRHGPRALLPKRHLRLGVGHLCRRRRPAARRRLWQAGHAGAWCRHGAVDAPTSFSRRSWERNGRARQRAADHGGRPLCRARRREDGHRRRAAPAAPRCGSAARDLDSPARHVAPHARQVLRGWGFAAGLFDLDQRVAAPRLRAGRLQGARDGRLLRPPRPDP
eukprot:scaffold51746_cov63-Phaeocystis_antarctica.AAC.3